MILHELRPGEAAWCSPRALVQDRDAVLWLLLDAEGTAHHDGEERLRVARSAEGFDVDRAHCRDHLIIGIERPDERFAPAYDHTRAA